MMNPDPNRFLSVHDISQHLDEPAEQGRFYEVSVNNKREGARTFAVRIADEGVLVTISDGNLISRKEYDVYEVETL